MPHAHRGQKRVSYSLEVELQTVVSHYVHPESFRSTNASNFWAISPALSLINVESRSQGFVMILSGTFRAGRKMKIQDLHNETRRIKENTQFSSPWRADEAWWWKYLISPHPWCDSHTCCKDFFFFLNLTNFWSSFGRINMSALPGKRCRTISTCKMTY